jgi:hypothetical protein
LAYFGKERCENHLLWIVSLQQRSGNGAHDCVGRQPSLWFIVAAKIRQRITGMLVLTSQTQVGNRSKDPLLKRIESIVLRNHIQGGRHNANVKIDDKTLQYKTQLRRGGGAYGGWGGGTLRG